MSVCRACALAALTMLAFGCAATGEPSDQGDAGDGSRELPIGARFQWQANYGYCGETSFISAGLYYGQYLSQYDARELASGGVDQSRAASQLLLGVNDATAAEAMRLGIEAWEGEGTREFLVWVKQQVLAGRPVIIGVYTNERRFYGDTDPEAGDAEYDHIVPVLAVTSDWPADDSDYHGDDTLTFSDNGLYGDDTPEGSPYYTTVRFDDFQATRKEANAKGGAWYSLPSDATNYGTAVTGVLDARNETLAVSVTTSVNYESPAMEDGSSRRPEASPVTLSVTVSGLEPGVDYLLLRYDDVDAVPVSGFDPGGAAASFSVRNDEGSSWRTDETVSSDEIVIYRAVRAG